MNLRFPPDVTLGGWLAGALAWRFAAMWLLVDFDGHRISDLWGRIQVILSDGCSSIQPMAAYRNVKLEIKQLLIHGTGEYN